MSRAASFKKFAPVIVAGLAILLLGLGVLLTWKTLAGTAGSESTGLPEGASPGDEVRIATDPGADARPAPKSPSSTLPAMEQGEKAPSAFGLPQFPDAFDFHSMEVTSGSGKSPIGSSAFLARRSRAADIARFYLLEFGKEGWELVWQRDARIHPNNDTKRAPILGTRLRWLDRNHRKQVTLLALDDPQKRHSAQAVVSWATLPGRSGG